MLERYAKKDDLGEGRWITVGGDKASDGSRHGGHAVFIGKTGEIKAGLGGKFTGKKISDLKSPKKSSLPASPASQLDPKKESKIASEGASRGVRDRSESTMKAQLTSGTDASRKKVSDKAKELQTMKVAARTIAGTEFSLKLAVENREVVVAVDHVGGKPMRTAVNRRDRVRAKAGLPNGATHYIGKIVMDAKNAAIVANAITNLEQSSDEVAMGKLIRERKNLIAEFSAALDDAKISRDESMHSERAIVAPENSAAKEIKELEAFDAANPEVVAIMEAEKKASSEATANRNRWN